MKIFFALLVAGLLLFTGINLWMNQEAPRPAQLPETGQGEAQIGGNFTLTDTQNRTVSESDFRGRMMLVFFGFTHCLDICPVSVATLSSVMDTLGDKAGGVAPIFITQSTRRAIRRR